jgi:hypothetical protein
VPICTAVEEQYEVNITSDGSGGAIIGWTDYRTGSYSDIYAQRVNAAGAVQWTPNGVAVSVETNYQTNPSIASDGAGGAILSWDDNRAGFGNNDIYAQRVDASGVPQWAANGAAICTTANNQSNPFITADGVGGAVLTWHDYRNGSDYDIYAQRVDASGAVKWTANGEAISTVAAHQVNPRIISNGNGGAIIAWYDWRPGGSTDIYAQSISNYGSPTWTADGVPICTAAQNQDRTALASDGAGGAIIAWHDIRSGINYDIYAQRLDALGAVKWTTDGIAICTATNAQDFPTVISDGSGGAIIAWYDRRTGGYDIYAQRVDGSGAVQWTADGVALCDTTGNQDGQTIAEDGAGGGVVAWVDTRSGYYEDIYVQRIGRNGNTSKPGLVSVLDVPNDQGGLVNVIWNPSGLDAYPDTSIAFYSVWRSLTGAGLKSLQAGSVPQIGPSDINENFQGPGYRINEKNGKAYAWEWLANLPWQHYLTQWSYLARTTCDSGPGGRVRNHYMVSAQTDNSIIYWDSEADSGYSIDNLPPSKALNLVGTALKDGKAPLRLDWSKETVADLGNYGVYRDLSAGFIPGPGNRIGFATDTTFTDNPAAECYYKVTAIDVHGNEGPASNEYYYQGPLAVHLSMLTAAMSGAGVKLSWRTESEMECAKWEIERSNDLGAMSQVIGSVQGHGTTSEPQTYSYLDNGIIDNGTYYYRLVEISLSGDKTYYGPISVNYMRTVPENTFLGASWPNPSHGEAITISYGLKQPATAVLKVYDVRGGLISTIYNGYRRAGNYTQTWDGKNAQGMLVSAGVYLFSLQADGQSFTRKMIVVK